MNCKMAIKLVFYIYSHNQTIIVEIGEHCKLVKAMNTENYSYSSLQTWRGPGKPPFRRKFNMCEYIAYGTMYDWKINAKKTSFR